MQAPNGDLRVALLTTSIMSASSIISGIDTIPTLSTTSSRSCDLISGGIAEQLVSLITKHVRRHVGGMRAANASDTRPHHSLIRGGQCCSLRLWFKILKFCYICICFFRHLLFLHYGLGTPSQLLRHVLCLQVNCNIRMTIHRTDTKQRYARANSRMPDLHNLQEVGLATGKHGSRCHIHFTLHHRLHSSNVLNRGIHPFEHHVQPLEATCHNPRLNEYL